MRAPVGPAWHSPRYRALTALRRELEVVAGAWLPPGGPLRLIDLGCGRMPYRTIFEDRGVVYLGADTVDNAEAAVRIGADGRVEAETDAFDVALSTQVLEHVQSPARYLGEAWRLLRPGGHLVLSTHGYWKYHPYPEDYWRWTGPGLRRVIVGAGFRVLRLSGLIGLPAVAVQLLQDATVGRLPRICQPLYCLVMQHLVMAAAQALGGDVTKDALVHVVVARKPEPDGRDHP